MLSTDSPNGVGNIIPSGFDIPVEQTILTAVVVVFAIGILALFVWRRSELKGLFDSPLKIAAGTVFATGFILLITAIVLSLWGRQDRLVSLFEGSETTTLFLQFMLTILTFVVVYGILLLARVLISQLSNQRAVLDAHAEQVIYRVTQLVCGIGAVVVTLRIWNINIENLLLGAGFLGIIVGLAARQSLASGLSGLILMFSRPFKIGDWVEIGDQRGIVVKITLVNTHIRAYGGEYVIIPNDRVSDSKLTNLTTSGRLQLRIDVGVDYDADLDHVITVIEEAVEELDSVDVPQVEVQPVGFGDSSIDFAVYFYITNPNETLRRRAQAEAINRIKKAFDSEGIEIPFPQRTLSDRDS